MADLVMEVRSVDETERSIVGVVAPYDEVSYLTGDPGGERLMRGCFAKSITQRGDKVPLFSHHDSTWVMGKSQWFDETNEGLVGVFSVNAGARGDAFLEDLRHGYYGGMSVGFQVLPEGSGRGADGVREVREAKLVEVSTVGLPAYEGAALIAVREAQDLAELLAPFQVRPDVNLEPIPSIWGVR